MLTSRSSGGCSQSQSGTYAEGYPRRLESCHRLQHVNTSGSPAHHILLIGREDSEAVAIVVLLGGSHRLH